MYAIFVKVAKKYRRSVTAQINEDLRFVAEVSHEWAWPEEEGEAK